MSGRQREGRGVRAGRTPLDGPPLRRFGRRYRARVLLWVVVAVASGAGAAVVVMARAPTAAAAVLSIVAAWAVARLVREVERPVREMRRFLEGVRYDDATGAFEAPDDGPLLAGLASAFESVGEAFRRVRAEREAQAGYLEAVVQHAGVGLLGYRTDGAVTVFNLAVGRALGVARPRTMAALAERSPEVAAALTGLPPGERSLLRVGPEGDRRELVVYASRVTVPGGVETLVSVQDIRDELEARELEAWRQLSRVLTHEITNSVAPIASLAGTARGLLEEGRKVENVREALGTIERRSRRLVGFVDAYRTLAGVPAPVARSVSAAELLGDVASLARVTTPGVEVAVEVDPPGLPVVADPELVEQALVNLALNAVEAVGDGGRVVLRATPGAGGRAVIEVVDDGPGLLPEVAERVFVPFFSTKPGGSGIGLALAHRIARLHGGSLTLESEPGVRTTFTLRL